MKERRIDLPEKTIKQLCTVFSAYPEIERVQVFGSRILGNAKHGSDVDLAFSGKNLTPQLVGKIHSFLEEETLFPYFFDCIHLETTKNKGLLEHIDRFGIDLYEARTDKTDPLRISQT